MSDHPTPKRCPHPDQRWCATMAALGAWGNDLPLVALLPETFGLAEDEGAAATQQLGFLDATSSGIDLGRSPRRRLPIRDLRTQLI